MDAFVLRWRPLLQDGEPGFTPDIITDFTPGEDKIAVSPGLARPPLTPLAATAFKDLSLGAVDADDRYLYDPTTGALYYDPDGSWTLPAVLIATVENHAPLTAADFLVF